MSEFDERFNRYVEGTGAKPIGVFSTLSDVLAALTGNYKPGVIVAEAIIALILSGVIVIES